MKKHLYVLAILAFGLHSCGPTYVVHQAPPPEYAPPPEPASQPAPEPPPVEVSYQSFYDQLAPYGQWINNPSYGYVWMPNVGPDFKPYATNGHWVYTDAGWTWASNYSWGWATFHYGRWFYEDGYGWMWIPGQEWAPAWVSWRQSSDYYGWAPLAPSNGPAAVSINISIGGGGYNPPSHYWNFVPTRYVTSPQVNNYYVNEQRNVTIINNTTVINNTYVNNNTTNITNNNIRNTNITNNNVTNNNVTNNITNNNINNNITNNRVNNTVNNYGGGPNPTDVSRYTGSAVRAVPLRTSATPGEQATGNGLAIYRPRVAAAPQNNSGGNNTLRPAPGRVQTLGNVRPVNTSVYNGNSNNTPNNPAINNRPAGNTNSGSTPNNGGNATAPNQNYNRPVTNPATTPVNTPAANNNNQPNNNFRQSPNQPNQYQSNQNRVTTPAATPAATPNNAGNNPAYNNGRPANNQPVRNNQPVSQPQQANQPVNQGNPRPVSQPARPGYQPANQQAGQQGNFNRNRFQAPATPQNQQQRANTTPPKPAPRPVTRPVAPPKDTEKKDNK